MNVKILVVEDSKTDMMLIKNMLYDYHLLFAYDGIEAMQVVERCPEIDIMILDLNMPRMDGFEVLQALKQNETYQNMTTLILTNYDETENEIRGLELGAVDYIRKPLNMGSLRKRIEVHLSLRRAHQSIAMQNAVLEERVLLRTRELEITRDVTIHALVGLLEARNIESSNHVKRTQWMIKILCEYLKTQNAYAEILNHDYITEIFQTAPLHDIGKVGIPDKILLKPGMLDLEEFEIMKKHTLYGVEALTHELDPDHTASFLKTAIDIVGTHHERYDGTGYPYGLIAEEIPLCGRLMSIIDVYDALTSERVYKTAVDHEQALKIIQNERGRQFDPNITDAFMEVENEIRKIKYKFIQTVR